ncbi:excinuclease ABC subunit UvrA [Planococcus shenhongbingii]|uniref:UvrABC system protein A n=1 Tax=Planococcus shenhongbingii TaxID=3058398 RepID=A0ABT8NDZ9_9BACL|nr:excinuclease ABC subunit UvrA [Planococcus sp. N017]MDN7246066.1 excinuclease ABC subunit UvrA [Planococcus sp. N017]
MTDFIQIKEAAENNLKNISVNIPKNKFVVITGPSGSGKSTLAIDILQRESQRQYFEMNGMTTNFINKPKVGSIMGLSPSVGVSQNTTTNRNPRSTVGTVTDMYTYLRVIYEKLGERECPNCRAMVKKPADLDEESLVMQCPNCGFQMKNLNKAHFSFNTLEGACETCLGLGKTLSIRKELVFDEERSLNTGAVRIWFQNLNDYYGLVLKAAAKHYGFEFDADMPLKDYSPEQRDLLYYGVESEQFKRHFPDIAPPKTTNKGKFEGILTATWRRYREREGVSNEAVYFYHQTCPECQGEKLKKESRLVFVAHKPISEVSRIPLDEILGWVQEIAKELEDREGSIARSLVFELKVKIERIVSVGLGYLSMDRQSVTLSGGESQRLRLATILGSALSGVLYILDEPTAGLHPKDTEGLVKVLKQLRDLDNTVLVIEHDVDVMEHADWIIDIGPGAGMRGGEIVGQGTLESLMTQEQSVTGAYLKETYHPKQKRRAGNGQKITVYNAVKNNLKNVTVSFPLGCFIAVTGVSGSGKSSLLFDVLAASAEEDHIKEGYNRIEGMEAIGRIVTVDQSALSRMQRSNVATYTEVYTLFRTLFAKLPESIERQLTAKHFSFNTEGGRCEHCQGMGYVFVNMHFLPDLEVICPVCSGKRFKEEVLEVTYQGHSISSILDLSIEESMPLFSENKKVMATISLLLEVGLGYLKWGQTLTTLSGGEAQRLKLAKELNKPVKGQTLYILDEPSTGLHPNDVKQLLLLLNKLVDAGNTVIIVEHNTEMIQETDWIIDLGPEGGDAGGFIVAEGTPEQVAKNAASYTGAYLKV